MNRFAAFVALSFALVAATATAQESVGVKLTPKTIELTSVWLSTLRVVAAAGDTENLAKAAAEFLLDVNASKQFPDCCDLATHYFVVLFTSTDAQGKPTIIHVLLHSPQPKNSTLPGLHGPQQKIFEVFLAEDESVSIQGSYDVEQVENPALKQLGDFVTTVIGKAIPPTQLTGLSRTANIFATMDRNGVQAEPTPTATFRYSVALGSVQLTHARAKLTVRHTVVITQPITHMRAVVSAAAAETRLKYGEISLEAALEGTATVTADDEKKVFCRPLIASTEKRLRSELDADVCKFSVADQVECIKKLKMDLSEALKDQKPELGCPVEEARAVVSAFQPAVSDVTRITGTTTLSNTPLQRYSFGLATGYIGGIKIKPEAPRAQIQSNKISANPFSRAIAMGVLNLPLWGYESNSFDLTQRERWRPFVGFPFSPYFGLSVGASYALTHTIAANVGYAALWYDTPAAGEQLDQAPVNKANPFKLGSTNAWFVAAGYNFK